MTQETPEDVVLIEIGRPEWPRWMICHTGRHRYWFKGRWRRRRRDGELWHDELEARNELQLARLNWRVIGIEDE